MAVKCKLKIILLICAVLFTSVIKSSLCCNGYKLDVTEVRNCDKPDIYKVKGNFTATLEENCDIVARGCAKLSDKPIKRFMLRYAINKPTLVGTRGEIDVCKATRQLDSPLRCPILPGRVCLNGELKVSILNYKSLLGLAKGHVKLELNGQLDKGKLCIEIIGNIEKDKVLMIS